MNAEVERLKMIFPEATYSRSHSLLSGGPIWDALEQSGITHDFTLFNPYSESTRKRILWNGLIQVEFNWEDDFHFHIEDFNVDHSARIIKKKDLILNFHPIHFFLNTKSKNDYIEYLSARGNKQKIADLQKRNWDSGFGCGNLLIKLLHNKPSENQYSIIEKINRLPSMGYLWK